MKKILKALTTPTLLLLLVISFIACDKDFYTIESDVLGENNANFDTNLDIYPIISYNKKLDSLQVNNLTSNLLGFYNDPEYGSTTASVITQINATAYNPDFGNNPELDSVILSIPYFNRSTGFDDDGFPTYTISDSLFGDEVSPIKLSIFESTYFLRDFNPDNLGETQKYYSHASNASSDNFARTDNTLINFDDFKSTQLIDTTFTPSSNTIITTTETDTLRFIPALRAKLDSLFWQNKILNKQGTPELVNANNFKNYFRGLYFKAEPVNNNGNMVLLNFASTDASITIYYKKDNESDSEGEKEQATYTFNFSGNRLNTFTNNYTKTLTNGNKNVGDDKLYIKGTEGSMAIVNLFDGLVDCDGDGNVDDDALECFKNRFRAKNDQGEYIIESTTGEYVLKQLINEAHLEVYEDDALNTGGNTNLHKYDRIYAYDVKNNIPLIDYSLDPTGNTTSPVSSIIFHLTQRDTINKKYKIRLTEHLNNILLRDSTNTQLGLVLSTNVNITGSSDILKSDDAVTAVPTASIITTRGTILYGSTENVPEEKRLKLKIFATKPNQ
ncbi:DUF4270 domain-containing protein [Seonamhaeicola algicola]|uniref:DUF4270 domain-containing protein n=1 Tax=Seonamhaeicola algicola TaxID=1719036 RepID=A0A5C7AXA7_9FLAO|nr:DUF4270 domain-containing protein [Seonamhaeicola algicola]TXE13161.1 DUF4270 domain-containing protein [Seonamhaeicola algicola]